MFTTIIILIVSVACWSVWRVQEEKRFQANYKEFKRKAREAKLAWLIKENE